MPSGTSPPRNTPCLLANRLIEWGCSAWRSVCDRNVPNTESSRSGHLLHTIVHLYPSLFSGHQVGNSPEGQRCTYMAPSCAAGSDKSRGRILRTNRTLRIKIDVIVKAERTHQEQIAAIPRTVCLSVSH